MATKSKDLKQLLDAYARVMIIWALLRGLMALSSAVRTIYLQFSLHMSNVLPYWIAVLVGFALAAYIAIVGRLGTQALNDTHKLKTFKTMAIIGLFIAGAALVLYFYLVVRNTTSATGDVFYTVIDFLFYAVGMYYAWRIENGAN